MNAFYNKCLKFYFCIFSLLILLSLPIVHASESTYHLSSEQWSVPRSVGSILNMQAISLSMQAIQQNENASLVIHHPGGDEGSLWALELRAWLISLGLSASKISLTPGSSDTEQLDLEIVIHSKTTIVSDK